MRASNVLSRISLHFTLIVLVVWSVLPFVWTMQTSIKFTRDVASKEPVLWGYETTGNAYRNFWLDTDRFEDGEASLWNVLWYVLAVLAVLAFFGVMNRRGGDGRPWFLGYLAVMGLHLLWIADGVRVWPVVWYLVLVGVIVFLMRTREEWDPKNWFIGGVVMTLWYGLWRFPKIWETESTYEFLINSIVVTVLTMLISLTIGLLAGYGLARYTGISGAVILIVALGFRALPRTAFVLPYFFGANRVDRWLRDSGLSDCCLLYTSPSPRD